MTIDDVLAEIQVELNLEADVEREVLDEIRGHLEEAVAAGRAQGLDDQEALHRAASDFGIRQSATELQSVHAGWGTLEGVALAALPVLLALVMRWMIFDPAGSAGAWRARLAGPALAIVAAVAVLVPLLRFPRRRYALVLWAFFWGLSLAGLLWPALRW